MSSCSILPIGDAHAKPGVSNRRFDWLGSFIAENDFDHVIDMGDWSDFPSLSSYDGSQLTGGAKPKKAFEGRRYDKDVEAGIEARDRVRRKIKGKRKKPKFWSLGGNHDWERIHRVVDNIPELDGKISIADQMHKEMGWELVPFMEPLLLCGFAFQHYFGSGLMQRAVSGENLAVTLLKTQFMSVIQAHTHLLAHAERTRADGQKIQAFSAACFLDPDQKEGFAKRANEMWYKGLLRLEDVENGYAASHSWVGIETIRRAFG